MSPVTVGGAATRGRRRGRAGDPADAPRRVGAPLLLGGLTAALLATAVVAAGSGQVHVPPAEVLGSLAHHLGLDVGPLPSHPQGENALWLVRLPRVCLAALVGAALACAGALLQGVFANPLATRSSSWPWPASAPTPGSR